MSTGSCSSTVLLIFSEPSNTLERHNFLLQKACWFFSCHIYYVSPNVALFFSLFYFLHYFQSLSRHPLNPLKKKKAEGVERNHTNGANDANDFPVLRKCCDW